MSILQVPRVPLKRLSGARGHLSKRQHNLSSVPSLLTRVLTMTGESGFDEVDRCIDEIAEVTRPPISHLGSNHASVIGARAWESKVQITKYRRASEVVWSPSYGPDVIQT